MIPDRAIGEMSWDEVDTLLKAATDHGATLTHDDWLAARRTGIGGSDAPVVCGVSPWKSPLTLWSEKRGLIGSDGRSSEAAEWGHILEPVILDQYARRTGRGVRHWPQTVSLASRERAWQRCTPDALQVERENGPGDDERAGPGIVQVKTVGLRGADRWEDGPPLEHQVQCQHELAVTGCRWGTIAVLVGGQELRYWDFAWNQTFVDWLVSVEADFWALVKGGEQPQLDGSPSTAETLKKLHPEDNGQTVELPDAARQWDAALVDLKERIKKLDEEKSALETLIRGAIGANTWGVLPDGSGRYSLKTQTRPEHVVAASTFRVLRRSAK